MSNVRHVLFDADGVLQHLPGGWTAAMGRYISTDRIQDFLQQTRKDERPTWTGSGDYMPLLAATLVEYGVTTPVEVVFQAVWHNIEVIEETFEVIDALRQAGYGVHLGTNQEQHRAVHMRTGLRYDDLFDVSCYSCDLGVASLTPASSPKPRVASEHHPKPSCSSTTEPRTCTEHAPPGSEPSTGTTSRGMTYYSGCSASTASGSDTSAATAVL